MQEKSRAIRVLHTSDWHLGRALHEHSRDDEFDAFLSWMLRTVDEQRIDVLLIAGDIFDTSNPPYSAQQRYYEFCTKLSRTCCKHAVITSGNHDSTTFIDVPAQILSLLNIHVIGQARFGIGKKGVPGDEVVVIRDDAGEDMLIVAAVPYLQDGDVRTVQAGEDIRSGEQKMVDGVTEHYRRVAEACEEIRAGRAIPVIAMGHLYASGGKLSEGERVTYVGSLGGVGASVFGETFDYVALGHLHVPQTVGGCETVRYSGAPLAMGFGEAGQQKSACMIEFAGKKPTISLLDIPAFRNMANVRGDKKEIESQLIPLVKSPDDIYIAVTYTGEEKIDNVMWMVNEMLDKLYTLYRADGHRNIYCLNTQIVRPDSGKESANPMEIRNESLEDFNETEVFERLLDANKIDESEREALLDCYRELLVKVNQHS